MSLRTLRFSVRDECGIALPLALIVLAVVGSLTFAFITLSATEPQIAANLVSGDQALALAEAGAEEAMWALTNPGAAPGSGIVFPLDPATIPARYKDGSFFVGLGTANTGGYTIAIAPNGGSADVTATGWVPNNAAPRAKRIVKVTFDPGLGNFPNNLPAAFTVKAQVTMQDTATVDARSSQGSTCGSKVGVYSKASAVMQGSSTIYGADGNNTANQSTDSQQNQPAASFDAFTLTQAQLNTLKAAAQANGAYYTGPQAQSLKFGNGGTVLKNGIVFVDTVSGNPVGNPPNLADLADVEFRTGVDASGWLVVMGSIHMNGPLNLKYKGLMYAVGRFEIDENMRIDGAVVSLANASNPNALLEDSTIINFDCNAIKNALPAGTGGWKLKLGTWREQAG